MGNKDFEVYNITIHKRFFDKYLTDLQALPAFSVLLQVEPLLRTSNAEPLHLTLKEQQLNALSFLLQEIMQHSFPDIYEKALICNNLVVVLIARLCSFYPENVGDADHNKLTGDKAFLNALALIHEHYRDPISIDTLAEIPHLSRSTLVRKFHEVCSTSPHKYLTKQRIEAAAHDLENTELSLAEIAESTGFYDTAHFTRVFKAETGSPPISYRKTLQNQTAGPSTATKSL